MQPALAVDRTRDLLIASPTPHRCATTPPRWLKSEFPSIYATFTPGGLCAYGSPTRPHENPRWSRAVRVNGALFSLGTDSLKTDRTGPDHQV